MVRIDPHAHTVRSDGTDTPTGLVEQARLTGLDIVGITDHDTFAGWEEASQAAVREGVGLLRGVEISTSADGYSAHLLGFLPDPEYQPLRDVLEQIRTLRVTRLQEMVSRTQVDYPLVGWEEVQRFAPETGRPIGRPHLADALVEAGYFHNRSEAFVQVLHPSRPYYVHQWAPHPVEMVGLLRDAGGVPVLAHPRAHGRQRPLPDEVVEEMVEAGLFGLERDHRDHDQRGWREADQLARRWKLSVFGGSDYHGRGKPNQLGENLTTADVIVALEDEATMEVIRP